MAKDRTISRSKGKKDGALSLRAHLHSPDGVGEGQQSHTALQWGCLTGKHSPQNPHLPDVPPKKLSSSESHRKELKRA